jgi:archaemetzincin
MKPYFWAILLMAACHKKTPEPPPPPADSAPAEEGFERLGRPKPGEWLYSFREDGQTFDQYVDEGANRKSPRRAVFYIQPLGAAGTRYAGTIALMREYAEVFFHVPARVCDPIPLPENAHVLPRDQYNATMIIGHLQERIPGDALVYIGIAGKDLFSKGLNFVFGEGSLRDRTGVYSLVRYETEDAALFLRRALKLMSHEVGHILSLQHCIWYSCVMQGANSLAEDDRHPMHLCPIDLRKLQWNTGFDPRDRYLKLREFYRRAGLNAEAEWVSARAK